MNLSELINRKIPPDPWTEGEKIPWHDPDFSSRMLHEHLSQDHNAASRRSEIIDQHVDWIHTHILAGSATKILDLGCGPGLYTRRLAKRGHTCVGIDYAPASIAYARQQAEEHGLDCTYIEADVREAPFGTGYGLVMMIHGELNVFRPIETRAILEKAREASTGEGQLVIEVHTLAAVRTIGEQGSKWKTTEKGLFSEQPHLLLKESYWEAELQVATERYFIVDAKSGEVTRHAASIQGYEEVAYEGLLGSCGFNRIRKHPSLGGKKGEKDKNYVVFTAKAAHEP
jgi:SAM-dependent methyltransferase